MFSKSGLARRSSTRDWKRPKSGAASVRVLVQFPSHESIQKLKTQAALYGSDSTKTDHLPPGLRRRFFDGLDRARPVSRDDRLGNRLREDGFPTEQDAYIDVDLWHPGTMDDAQDIVRGLRDLCEAHGGRVFEEVRTSSLILARVRASGSLTELLLDLDLVAQVNLPPTLPIAYTSLFDEIAPLPEHSAPTGKEPLVGILDSGILPGHSLLRGWVVEGVDFDTGENTAVDRYGHGTQVAGLVVYGDVARCIEAGRWAPQVLVANAKVLRRHPTDERLAVFPDHHRPEALVERAIRHFHRTRDCRVFNLSVGNADDVYSGGRQFPWAEVLDRLARELDIVIVVSAGNDRSPLIPPDAVTREQFQSQVRDALLTNAAARICNPGTASIAVTVGSIARCELPRTADAFPGAPAGGPAPFSRVGPGYECKRTQRAVKPEFVAHGGNLAVRSFAGMEPTWIGGDLYLGEPTTRLEMDDGRPLTASIGTSLSAPQVSNAAARAMEAGAAALGTASANLARAILGVSADAPPCGRAWLCDPDGKENWDKLRLVGYGVVSAQRIETSLANDTCLIASDVVEEDHWHVYGLPVPSTFLAGSGARGISVSLAYDPPVRSGRKEYLSRTMWLEVLKGLASDEIETFRARHNGPGKPLSLPQCKVLQMRPTKTDLVWSTLQVRRKTWVRAPRLPILEGEREPRLHLLVGCQRRFPHGEELRQRYSIAVRFWHSSTQVNLYQELRARVRPRIVVETRARAVVK